ncbi:MAG: PAS domain-containing protein [Chloroflexi bacterium]|nr:PAS domain-containing protein [Chloroflexota bacterium]
MTFLLSTILLSRPRRRVLLCLDEITERKRAEEARERLLRQIDEERAKLTATVLQMPAGLFIADAPSGNVILINREMEVIWRREFPAYGSFEEYARDNTLFYRDGRPYPTGERPLARAIRGEIILDEEVEFGRGDGSRGIALISAVPVKDAGGDIRFGVAVLRDITGQILAEESIKRLNDDLRRHTAELEASNRELESFAYSVSHDLRAPLRTLDGFSQALVEDYGDKLDGQAKDYLRRIQESSRLMGQLIDDLLSLSRVTRTDMRIDTVDLSNMAREILDELQNADSERRAKFVITPGMAARGDPNLLRLVLENLLGNSWKFTGKTSLAVIEFASANHDGKTAYFVRDNGAGFDMAYAGKLFAPFQRLHSMNEFPGVGIGLATVQRVIHRHGGKVWANGEVGEGATFYFTLD